MGLDQAARRAGSPGTPTHRVATPADLVETLDKVRADPDHAAFVELVLPRDDAPDSLVQLARSIR